ncbi:hypothetical protein Sjap_002298 [Stephania japonica]|uniref:Uncharacterized protein n=1 Tax=Stephania japonica TaxID=461633 RepID=A0AAP0KN84_9MAGN
MARGKSTVSREDVDGEHNEHQSSEVVVDLLLARPGAARRIYTHCHKLDGTNPSLENRFWHQNVRSKVDVIFELVEFFLRHSRYDNPSPNIGQHQQSSMLSRDDLRPVDSENYHQAYSTTVLQRSFEELFVEFPLQSQWKVKVVELAEDTTITMLLVPMVDRAKFVVLRRVKKEE